MDVVYATLAKQNGDAKERHAFVRRDAETVLLSHDWHPFAPK